MQTQDFKNTPVIGGKDIDFFLEYSNELVFVHAPELRALNKTSIDEMRFLIEEWGDFLKTQGYPAVFGIIPQTHKTILRLVLKHLGFKVHAKVAGRTIVRLDLGDL